MPVTESVVPDLARMRAFVQAGPAQDLALRKRHLKALRDALQTFEPQLLRALHDDLGKGEAEAFMSEILVVRHEIDHQLKHLARWARPKRVGSVLHLWPSRSEIQVSPLGVALIVSPWNYPVQLLLAPLVGALSAGCAAVLKPSPFTPHVNAVLGDLIRATFADEHVTFIEGGKEVMDELLQHRFDLIFFTGSTATGRTIMRAAAEHLTPVVLELGGKSPVLVDRTADLALAARRIAWGKMLNAGQTCVAPDYLLVHRDVRSAFIDHLAEAFTALLGTDPAQSPHYGRLIHDAAFERQLRLLQTARVLHGGQHDRATRFLAPTVLEVDRLDHPLMEEELFGPVLPLLEVADLDEALSIVTSRDHPLALYYFGEPATGRSVFARTQSGGGCINDTIMHLTHPDLPFGGVGHSGMGAYHGEASFRAFSHYRSVVIAPTGLDLPFRYPPYRGFGWLKRWL